MAETPSVRDLRVSLIHPKVGLHEEARHDHHELILVDRGPYRVETGGRRLQVHQGQGVFYPQGCLHRPIMPRDLGARIWVMMWRGWTPSGWVLPFVIDDAGRRVLMSVVWISDRLCAGVPTTALLADHLLIAMLSEVEARLVVPDTADDPLLRARQILDDAPQHPWSLTELACHVGLSPAYLCRRFAARFGEPPMAWVGRRRLDAALALRQAGRLPRREIAAAAGYADPDSLNRALRRRGRHGHCG